MAPASDDLTFDVPGYGELPEPARQRMRAVVHRLSVEILAEAARLESDWRPDPSGSPELTSRDIDDATALIRRAPNNRRTTRSKVYDAVAFAAAFVGGVFGNNIDTSVGAIGFAACAFVGVIAYTNRGEQG